MATERDDRRAGGDAPEETRAPRTLGTVAFAPGGAEVPWTEEDESYCRDHYAGCDSRLADREYGDVRHAYQLGHAAAAHEPFRGRPFDEVEPELERRWREQRDTGADARRFHPEWSAVRGYAGAAYSRHAGRKWTPAARHISAHRTGSAGSMDLFAHPTDIL